MLFDVSWWLVRIVLNEKGMLFEESLECGNISTVTAVARLTELVEYLDGSVNEVAMVGVGFALLLGETACCDATDAAAHPCKHIVLVRCVRCVGQRRERNLDLQVLDLLFVRCGGGLLLELVKLPLQTAVVCGFILEVWNNRRTALANPPNQGDEFTCIVERVVLVVAKCLELFQVVDCDIVVFICTNKCVND